MSDRSRYAILLDGGFVIKKLQQQLKRFPNADDVEQLCSGIMGHAHLANKELLRCYFYHAPPAEGDLINPLDKSKLQLGNSPVFRNHTSLMGKLELKPNFALRLGETVVHEWRLGTAAMRALMGSPRAIQAQDLVPNIQQKGVDLRIGLDIARLALRELVGAVVVVTGDSDLIPAFKFARREGVRVYLETLGHGVRRDLKAHVDIIL